LLSIIDSIVSYINKDSDKLKSCTGEDDFDVYNYASFRLKIIIVRLTVTISSRLANLLFYS